MSLITNASASGEQPSKVGYLLLMQRLSRAASRQTHLPFHVASVLVFVLDFTYSAQVGWLAGRMGGWVCGCMPGCLRELEIAREREAGTDDVRRRQRGMRRRRRRFHSSEFGCMGSHAIFDYTHAARFQSNF